MRNNIFLLLILPVFSLLHACATTSPLTPSQTAQQFWVAVLDDNMPTAQRYATQASSEELRDIQMDLSDAAIEFQNVTLQESNAKITTTITFPQVTQKRKIAFSTFIEREANEWKVDFVETKKSIQTATSKRSLGRIFDNLQKYSDEFSGSLDELVRKWGEATPEIRKDLEILGDATKEEVEQAIKHLAPEIKQGIRDFQNSIAEALKRLEPREPEAEDENKPRHPKMI